MGGRGVNDMGMGCMGLGMCNPRFRAWRCVGD